MFKKREWKTVAPIDPVAKTISVKHPFLAKPIKDARVKQLTDRQEQTPKSQSPAIKFGG